jgi:hypothetical protein
LASAAPSSGISTSVFARAASCEPKLLVSFEDLAILEAEANAAAVLAGDALTKADPVVFGELRPSSCRAELPPLWAARVHREKFSPWHCMHVSRDDAARPGG